MKILIYATKYSSRLQYTCGIIFKELYGLDYLITTDATGFINFDGIRINYSESAVCTNEFRISPVEILFQNTITPQTINCFTFNNYKVFFKTAGSNFGFDIFAACFYLLSRYEEYLPHLKDTFGRYAHENSLAFKEDFLQLPLINIWVRDLEKALKNKFPGFLSQQAAFKFIPTYDIDIAYCYKHKGISRNIGGFIKQASIKRIMVLLGLQKDPFDVYDNLDELHEKYKLHPIYFFLLAARNKKYDKNILPERMRTLIKNHSKKYFIGIHPSWQSGDAENLLQKEKAQLQAMSGKNINQSRQHYIRFTMPQSFRKLLLAGITEDYSMGYGSINGFRASIAAPFYWFDLEKNEQTNLKIHPFCFMDANALFEQKISPAAAFEELLTYYHACKMVDGNFISIWHNNILGTGKLYKGWGDVYKKFIEYISTDTVTASNI